MNNKDVSDSKMNGLRTNNEYPQKIAEFYRDKTVFITGAAGFVGSVLLEALLRSCPGIKSIYVLLRSKKNVQPEQRKEQIFDKKVFEKLKDETPAYLEKVCVIPGDICLPNLGMSDKNVQLLVKEVSVVFHCAAIINFKKPLEFTLQNNVLSLHTVIELCKQMKKFEALVYTSTAYSNCNRINFTLEEEIYRLPWHSKKFLEALKNEEYEKLQGWASQCKPDWPNSYCFSKCLAENVILDTASNLPVAIIRPSIIVNTWKNPMPGYIEDNSGIVALSIGAGKGFVKVTYGDPSTKLNLVPVDIVANAHVVAAWSLATKRFTTPLVVNCTATENLQVPFKEYTTTLYEMAEEYPVPRSFAKQRKLIVIPYKFLYYIFAAYHHYLPAIFLDGILRIFGKKPRIYSLYRFLDTVMSSMAVFVFQTYRFEKKNMEDLNKMIHLEERKDLDLDFSDATFLKLASAVPHGSGFYDWKTDKRSPSERKKIVLKRHFVISCVQGTFLIICCLFLYWVFSCIFK